MNKAKTTKQHEEFVDTVLSTIHCKLNSRAQVDGLMIEIGQYNRAVGDFKTNGYWYNENVRVLVLGNDKIQYYFDKNKLWDWIVENKDRIGVYLNGSVRGISLSIKESHAIASMVIK